MKTFRWTALVGLLMTWPVAGFAQTDAGRIAGTVRDASAAFVAGATVTITNTRTGDVRTVETNNEGYFIVSPLRPSTYTVKAEKSGFAPVEYPDMLVAVGQELVLDFEFRPAGVQETVTVTAEAPIVDVSSARLGVNVSERDVATLPVNGRQMSQLLLQAPGAANAGTGTWQDIRFSGRSVEQNAIRYDGIEGSAIVDASPGNLNGEIASPFKLQASLENVQEFRVESSGYPAEYGTGTGGQVSVITKSGGNDFHGSAFEILSRRCARRRELLRNNGLGPEGRAAAGARPAAVRRLGRRADCQEQGLLLQQLRSATIWKPGSTSSKGCQARRPGRRPTHASCLFGRCSTGLARFSLPARPRTRTSTSTSCRARRRSSRRRSTSGSTTD